MRRLERRVCREQAENVRNVHVGWFFRHAGTACRVLPREIWRCVPCKRYRGERGEGAKDREREEERDGCVCVCVVCMCVREVFLDRVDKRFPGAFLSHKTLWGNTSHIKHTLLIRMVNKRILCAIPLSV